jgi:hypothetical protein
LAVGLLAGGASLFRRRRVRCLVVGVRFSFLPSPCGRACWLIWSAALSATA